MIPNRNLKLTASCLLSVGLAVSLLAASGAEGASLTSGADFLLMTTGARPDGMGQAFSAVADDINTLSFNPAGLGNIRLPQVGYSHETFIADINYDFLGAAVPVGSLGVLGFGYLSVGTAPFNSTINPSAPSVSVQDTALMGAWGKSFYNLHLGAAVKYVSENLAGLQGSGIAFDFGARYRFLPQLTLAGSVLNVGSGVKFSSLEALPLVVNGGAAWNILDQPDHNLTLAADVSYKSLSATERYSFGAEYWFRNLFALRAGYQANSQVEGISAGIGFKYSFFQIDYAFEPYNNLGAVHRFSGIFQWDGPWVSGGEPNAPKNVVVQQTFQALEIHWDKAQGPVQSYEVLIQPLDGGDLFVSSPISTTAYEFKDYKPGTAYRVSVRSIGMGGAKSFPSSETLVMTQSKQSALQTMLSKDTPSADKQSASKGLYGKVDSIGLQLSWAASREKGILGYNLYRQPPSGQMEKVNSSPKSANKVWVTGVSSHWEWEWIVTSVQKGGKEKTLGSFLWSPTPREIAQLSAAPTKHLKAVPQPKRQVFLVWDGEPDATSYTLFYSLGADGVYEVYKEIDKAETNLLLDIPGGKTTYYFLMAPKKTNGEWSSATQEAEVQLYQDSQAQ